VLQPLPSIGAVVHKRESGNADQEARGLLTVAKQFRDAASRAGRPDVVAKIDEAIVLVAGTDTASQRHNNVDKANVVQQILDGLGF
jgi:hypothetical protein